MISIPIIGWLGEDYFDAGVMFGVVLQACAVLAILQQAWNTITVIKLGVLLVPLTWLLEFVGSQTGFPFGSYHYTELLQPQLIGVPLIIPVAWLMMLPVSWAIAAAILQNFAGQQPKHNVAITHSVHHYDLFKFSALAGLAMTAWDLFLDPQMVAWGYWVWQQPGSYFGIPLVNFLGWWASSSAITLLVRYILRPTTLPIKPLVVIYAIVWALQSIGQAFFWNQPGPAIVGFIGMGIPLWFARAAFLQDVKTNEPPSKRAQQ